MYDLVDMSAQMTPEERAMITAQALRRQQFGERLQQAQQQAGKFNNLAAITQMANNPAAAAAAAAAQRNAQGLRPVQMGNQGFMLPSSGEFVPSPMYEDEKKAERDNRRAVLRETLASRETLAREAEQGRGERAEDMAALRRELAQQQRALQMTLAGMRQPGGAATPSGRNLSGSDVERLTKRESVAQDFTRLAESFKDDFAGTTFLATAENALGRYQPLGLGKSYGDQSNWWQNYNDAKNLVRNALFGSALTATEQAAFDRANITEGMSASEIRRRLNQQAAAASRAYNKIRQNYGRGGFNVDQFPDLAVPEAVMPGSDVPQRPQAQNPVQPGVNLPRVIPPRQQPQQVPNLNLPPGFRVIGPAQ